MIFGQSKYAATWTLRSTLGVAFLHFGKGRKQNQTHHILLIPQFKGRRDAQCSDDLLPITQQFLEILLTKKWLTVLQCLLLKKNPKPIPIRIYWCQNKTCEQNIKESEERKKIKQDPWIPLKEFALSPKHL